MFQRIFSKVWVWLKPVIFGLLIVEVVTKIWSLLAGTNILSSPSIPWSFPAMALLLWVIWKFLGGSFPPKSTGAVRKENLRAEPLEPENRIWSIAAAALLGVTLLQLMLITIRLTDFAPAQIGQIEKVSVFPALTVIALILMTSLVAAVAEEAGLRGYMQKPIENAYGPAIAVAATAFVFTLLHLPNATIAPITIPIFFFGSLGWGLLAFLTGSIRPGIVVHFLIDLIAFSWTWSYLDAAKSLARQNVLLDGVDSIFVFQILLFTVTLTGLVAVFLRLGIRKRSSAEV